MQVENFIESVGGRKIIVQDTGLTPGRISQWIVENKIPGAWRKYFKLRFPRQYKQAGGK